MRIADMLLSIANWLESPDNEAILLAEYDDNCLEVVAQSCIQAAELLKTAANKVDVIEPPKESAITAESLEELAAIATAFDQSSDPALRKQASVIDELLLTIAVPQNYLTNKKAADDKRLDDLARAYNQPQEELKKLNGIKESGKDISNSGMIDEVNISQQPLSTRYDPDHPGVQLTRIGDGVWQSEMTKKIYDFNDGFKLENGKAVPGGSVAAQTDVDHLNYHTIFDTREGRLGKA